MAKLVLLLIHCCVVVALCYHAPTSRNPVDWNSFHEYEANEHGCPPGSYLKTLSSETKGDVCRLSDGDTADKKNHFVCPGGCVKAAPPLYCVSLEEPPQNKPCRAQVSQAPVRGGNFTNCLTLNRGFMPRYLSEDDARRVLYVVGASFERNERVQRLETSASLAPSDLAARRTLRREFASAWVRARSSSALAEHAPLSTMSDDAAFVAVLLSGEVRSFLTPPVQLFWELVVGAMRESGRKPLVFGSLVARGEAEEQQVRTAFEGLGIVSASLEFTRHLVEGADQHTRRAEAFRLMLKHEREAGTATSHVLVLRPDCLYLPLTRAESLAQLFEADDVVVVSSDLFASMPRRLAGLYPS
eukprot:CAMPEP_0172598690 /NCGR_PEP_ID=MMETSP1068-20121228/18749_1 /TAXON_ID=35684 /ORGANISM="Pseudopedinella elastica, Strain CCMP716" /LENGTH=356 /DNA_ID=CAMNT_0013398655 /DNA_START=159 /DNA_END=1226 /DNA_ORIENTATION=+